MDFEAMRDQITGAGFGDLLDVLADQAQSALLLEPAVSGAGVGRLGGLASLPPGEGWPTWRWRGYESQPMTFVAEFDLAALDEAVWPGPRSGSLSFFAAVEPDALYIDSGGAALVLHHAADIERSPVEHPQTLDEALRYRKLAVDARRALMLPVGGQTATGEQFGQFDPDYDRQDAYLQLRHDLLGDARDLLLGGPLIEDEAATDPDVTAHLWPSLHVEAVEHGLAVGDPPADWQMLLQVRSDHGGSDQGIGFQFGDGGTLAFAIPEADLAAGRFSRVQAFTDSL